MNRLINYIQRIRFNFNIFDINFNHPLSDVNNPKRAISRSLRLRIFLSDLNLWVGLLFFAVGTFFLLGIIPITDFDSLFFFGSDLQKSTAKIIKINATNVYENDSRYYKYTYEFNINNKKYYGSSYDTENDIVAGNLVSIEHKRYPPYKSRIVGMSMAPFNIFWLFFALVFPITGLILILKELESGIAFEEVMLIRYGLITSALAINHTKIIESDGDGTIITYDIFIEFRTSKGETIQTNINISDSKKVKLGKYYQITYLPWNPTKSKFLNSYSQEALAIIKK